MARGTTFIEKCLAALHHFTRFNCYGEPLAPGNGEVPVSFFADALRWVRRCTHHRLALSRLATGLHLRLLFLIIALQMPF